MRRTLDDVMTSVSVQTSRPKGFASCWKQEPMTLEDAHGKLIPLPIELVVSWEMFDIILLGHFHFQALVGEKKVQKREFEIEDSTTRDPLTRKRPWPTFSKPGRKIDMSMIFKDSGVLVECPNPDCKMLFRTEDDEDNDNLSKPPRLLKGRSPMELLPASSEDLRQEEADDKPGMFKRVIIRLLKYGSDFASSEFGGNIDGYPLSDASSYIGLPQVQILASEGSSKPPNLEMPWGCLSPNAQALGDIR
ncbi:uncharacterized protein K444DRAFT_262739 [Hyaloscypha bicolor E]|uniref:Ubiquitin-like domain-containing protein n=1 Tax=Hyaloscypha bicolor E TaxID=1095630 RepID=A0A2J6SHI9_9HELO|nr:uncharacterized protein K444DRAFT_262739 [Hyaloscypha bicolor E]PMD50236.1 hypothetical protein K444DRAFT_262739 [Hyaloscypha bicolor E]